MHLGSLILQSSKSEIGKLESLLFAMNESIKIDSDRFVNFHIAVSEALVNAIVHGNCESTDKKVYVDINEERGYLEVIIKDEGTGFNLNDVPDPTKNNNLYKDHGRGIFIMRSLTDGYECFSDEKGTIVKLQIMINK